MKYIYSVVEQLDLAGQQLKQVHPAYARFALLLADNIVELMLHRQCRKAINADGLMKLVGQPKYDAKTRSRVLGHHVDEKIKFCRDLGLIDQDEFDFILIAHEYRNELYHVGIRHERLIYPLAWEYHSLACSLFAKLKVDGCTWGPRDDVSEAARRHWPDGKSPFHGGGAAFSAAKASLLSDKPELSPSFAQQVSAYAASAAEKIDDALDFLVHDNMGGLGEAEMLKSIQFHGFIRSQDGEKALGFQEKPTFEAYFKRLAEVEAGWAPVYSDRPTPRWIKRAIDLARFEKPADVLRRYVRLRDEMEPLERIVFAAAAELDEGIQLQIDAARGK